VRLIRRRGEAQDATCAGFTVQACAHDTDDGTEPLSCQVHRRDVFVAKWTCSSPKCDTATG